MASKRQIAANRRNGKLSKGPRTAAGKARSSLNAVTHGLSCAHPYVTPEERAEFDALRQSFLDYVAPSSASELVLVERMVHAAWNSRRIRALEADETNLDTLLRLWDYSFKAQNSFSRALRDLQAIANARAVHVLKPESAPVLTLRALDIAAGLCESADNLQEVLARTDWAITDQRSN